MLVEIVDPVGNGRADCLDPREMIRVEAPRERRGRWPARNHQDGVVLVAHAGGAPADGPVELCRVVTHWQGERAEPIARNDLLDALLGPGELRSHDGFGILGEVGVPEGVVAEFETPSDQILELADLVLRLAEESVGFRCGGQDEEDRS